MSVPATNLTITGRVDEEGSWRQDRKDGEGGRAHARAQAGGSRRSRRPAHGRRTLRLHRDAPDDWLAGPRVAAPEGTKLDLVPVVVRPGGGSFHHGLTWHGSAPNTSGTVARMALVSHLIPAETRFHETNVDITYSRYRRHGDLSLDESFFPIVWSESGYRTSWLAELPDLD